MFLNTTTEILPNQALTMSYLLPDVNISDLNIMTPAATLETLVHTRY